MKKMRYFKKRISVSPKRQITLPLAFVNQLGIEQEVDGAFDDLILAELISEGYSGQELLCKFKEQRSKIRPAVEKLLEEADRAATDPGLACTYEAVFETKE